MPVRRHIYDRFFNLRYDYDIAFGDNVEYYLEKVLLRKMPEKIKAFNKITKRIY